MAGGCYRVNPIIILKVHETDNLIEKTEIHIP